MDLSKKIIRISSKPREHEKTRYATFKREVTNDEGVRTTSYATVPLIEEDHTPVELFNIFREFDHVRVTQHMDEDGAKLFDNFRTIVAPCRKATKIWEDLCDGVDDLSVENFDLTFEAFKMDITRKLNYQDQLEYIRSLRKPGSMSVDDFARELSILNDLAKQFPDAPENATGIDENEMVRIFYHAMPVTWQEAYMSAGYRYYSSTFHEVYDYMEAQEENDPFEPNKNVNGNKNANGNNGSGSNGNSNPSNRNINNRNRNNQRRNNNHRRGNQNNGGSNKGNKGNNNKSDARIKPDDPCPLPGHGNHTWYLCYENKHGKHGDDSKKPRGNSGESNTAEKKEKEEGEQHFMESPDVAKGFSYLFEEEDDGEMFLSEVNDDSSDLSDDDDDIPQLVPRAATAQDDDDDDDSSDDESVNTRWFGHPRPYNPHTYGGMKREDWERHCEAAAKRRAVREAEERVFQEFKRLKGEIKSDEAEAERTNKPIEDDAKPTADVPKKEPDAKTTRSGPLPLSKGAYESFIFDALTNDGVDQVLYPSMEPLNLVPTTISAARSVNGRPMRNTGLKTLIDHGASHSMINKRCLPNGVKVTKSKPISFSTTAGTFNSDGHVILEDFRLPEFNRNRSVDEVKCSVLDNKTVKYDVILGRDFLNKVGIDVKSSTLTCEWFEDVIPFKPPSYITNDAAHDALIGSQTEPETIVQEEYENHAVTFTATKSTFSEVEDVVDNQTHLDAKQKQQLLEILQEHTKLFSGKLGCFPHRKFHIDLKPGTVPYHCKAPYPVANALRHIVKAELERQVNIGVLERVNESLWGMPMLFIPKKDGAIRTVDDMRKLNECILRRVYPLPRIMDMLRRHYKWIFVTVLDLTLCYYSYELDEESSWLCILVTPFGKFRRKRLSMGLAQSPDWAQAALEETLRDELHDFVECYIDDVAIFSSTWEEHIEHVSIVLNKLEANGYTVNPAKCHWGVAEVEWMGHLITRDGLKPWPKKVEGIVNIAQPQSLKQLRAFIGMVNFYRDFWKKRADIMAPLTALMKVPRKEFLKHWTDEHTKAFKATKAMIAEDVLLAYPDPNKLFVIETDASDYQLGAIGYQDNQPVFMWSRKLSKAQRNYSTPDKEAACIVEVLYTYRSMLFGSPIEIHTDHLNLTRNNFTSLRLLKWRVAMEEFAPKIVYKPGADNVVADGLSRLPLIPSEEQDDPAWNQDLLGEVMLYYPTAINAFPLEFGNIRQEQQDDATIQAKLQDGTYVYADFGGHNLATKVVDEENRIVVPESIHESTINWYHYILGHCGQERLIKSIRNHLSFPGLDDKVKNFVETCDECQRYKNNGRGYGHLPPRDDDPAPFEDVALDHIGPWTLDVPNQGALKFHGLTIIDIATSLCEIIRVDTLDGEASAMHFENSWLSRYPRPNRLLYDAASAFNTPAFQLSLNREGITGVPITVKNPQANAIVERSHQTVGNMLRTLQSANVPNNVETAYEIIDTALASAQRAIRTAVHKSLGVSPGSMVFHRDMLLNIPTIVDLQQIADKRRAIADRNNLKENRRRRYKNYNIGDEVLILVHKPTKMGARAIGPYTITQVHVNGTVTIQRRANVTERINIRRIKPYNRRV